MTSLSPRGSPRTHSRNLRGPLKRVVTPQSESSDSEESDYDESSPNSDESSEDSSNSASDVEKSPSPILKRRKSSPLIQMRTATDPDFAHRKKQIEEELSKKLLEDDTDEIIEDIIDEDLRSDEPSLKIEEPQIKIEQDLPQIENQLSDPMIPESNEILPPKIQPPSPIIETNNIETTTTTTTAAAVTMETAIDADMSEFSEILLGLEKPKFHNCGQIVWTKYEDSFWPGLTIEVTSAPQYVLKRREENKQIVKLFGYKDNCVWAYPRDIVVFKSEDQFDVKKKKRNFTKAISEMKMYLNKDNNNVSSPPQQQQVTSPVVRPQRRQQQQTRKQIEEEEEQVPIINKNNDTSSRSTRRRTNTTSVPPPPTHVPKTPSKAPSSNKKSTSASARINRPRLGEIPELENKRVSCGLKSGRIHKNIICCDCCQVEFSVGSFEEHAGRAAARNPYKTILVTESGKPLDEYRYCTYCHTRETGFWREGPFGDRTLCDPCGQKWKEGVITEVLFKPIVVSSKTAECRRKTEFPAKKITSHSSNCLAVPVIDITDFTPDIYLDQVINKRTPLVLRNANSQLTPSLWTLDYLRQSHGDAEIQVRYMEMEESDDSQFAVIKDTQKTLSWFIDHMRNPDFSRDPDLDLQCVFPGRKPIVYAKDFSFGEIVPEWLDDLSLKVPLCLVPHERNDIMGNVPPNVRNIVWMGYMGNTGSRTPLHVDKLATVAFNMHVCGEGVKNWWLVSSDEIEKLEKIIEENGGNLYKDAYWMSPSELENTGMKMWYHQQQKGDMVIVPPNVPHTVINEGGFSCAVAANVMHENVVEDAWKAEKINRSINRVSIYRLKNTVYHSVNKMINEYRYAPTQQICDSLQKLIGVFEKIILEEEEQIAPDADIVFVPSDEYFLCDRCSCDIFNRRYHCSECKVGDYDLCVQCYLAINKEHYHEMKLYQKISLTSLHDMLREARDICEKHVDIKRPDQRMSVTSLLLN